jgi:hypothetical protein
MANTSNSGRLKRSRGSRAARVAADAVALHAYSGLDIDCEAVARGVASGKIGALDQARRCCELCWVIAGRVLRRGDEIASGDDVALSYHERRLIQIADLLARASRLYIEGEASGQAPEDPAPVRVIVEDATGPAAAAASEVVDDEA